jgi:NDP-sugar pyrophosphorylase family protein
LYTSPEALIIAAGKGDRIDSFFSPKPLVPVSGMPLLERIIHNSARAGIQRFKIVLGYKANQIKSRIGNGHAWGVKIDYVFNDEWEGGNGLSVLKAREYLQSPFCLLMGDHLFDVNILSHLLKANPTKDACLLCVDSKLRAGHIRLVEATKVLVEGRKILQIGKAIDRFNGVDTGIFLCSEAIFQALEYCRIQGKDTLSEANQKLCDEGKLQALDIGGKVWIDIDDREDLDTAQRLLQKLT